jgi:uncharacterized protein YjdB
MKIKIFTLLLCGMFAMAVSGQQEKPEASIHKSAVVPVLDGVIDDLWDEAEMNLFERNFREEIPTVGDSYWKMLWSDFGEDAGVYILIWVDDDDYWPHYISGGANSWEYDKIEIYFDCNTWDLDDGLGASGGPANGHHQIAVMYEEGKIDGTKLWGEDNPDADPIWYSHMVNDPDVIAEYFIPLEFLVDNDGGPVDLTAQVGFDITLIDQDEGITTARQRRVWANEGLGDGDESWNNMNYAGLITFEGASDKIFVESVTLEAEDITQNNKKIQIKATVLPEDATSKLLGWTVENVTGRAKIDNKGVLTPIVDGLVTVTAAAKDGSYVETSVDINISGQIVSMPEINLIRNGYFKQVDADGTATEWTGNPSEVQVVEGVLTVDAPPNGAEVWSYTVIQQNFGCNTTDQYWLTFVEWADESDTMNIDFEDPANGYNRYGSSAHEFSNSESDWTFETEVVPTRYLFDVVFNEKVENTVESFQLMVGKHDPVLHIDSIVLYNENDLALLSPAYTAVESITVSADGDALVARGSTLQMMADVQPADADYKDVYWSVEPGTGDATIDGDGVLTGDSVGTVTVMAMASDDSEVFGTLNVEVTWGIGVEQHRVNTLKLYPNPAVNELNIVLSEENSTVSIYNSVGQRVKEIVVSGNEYRLDISSYERGIYFVKSGNLVAKFIK